MKQNSQDHFDPLANDNINTKPGGLGEQILGDKLTILEFPDMAHGFTTRGDLSNPEVKRDVEKAMEAAVKFFDKHVK